MTLLIFVGDRHSPIMSPDAKPFVGARSEPRLKEWINYITDNQSNYVLVNSYKAEDTKKIKEYAKFRHKVTGAIIEAPLFIALGNTASLRLKKLRIPHFKLPHPSGLNRQINNAAYIKKQLDACRVYITYHR